MSKLNWKRFKQSEKERKQNLLAPIFPSRSSTKPQAKFALSLLKELGLERPDDHRNIRAMRRRELSVLINQCLARKQERQSAGNKPSPSPNQNRDNALRPAGPVQGETLSEVAEQILQP